MMSVLRPVSGFCVRVVSPVNGYLLTLNCQLARFQPENCRAVCKKQLRFYLWPFAPIHQGLISLAKRRATARHRMGEFDMLNNIGLPGILLIAVVVLVLFGRGKISSLMGEVGKGITSFKKGVSEGQKELEDAAAEDAKDVTPETEKDKV